MHYNVSGLPPDGFFEAFRSEYLILEGELCAGDIRVLSGRRHEINRPLKDLLQRVLLPIDEARNPI